MKRKAGFFGTLIAALGLLLIFSLPAEAVMVPAAYVIDDGLSFNYRGTDHDGLSVFTVIGKAIHPVVNGQKSPTSLGNADIFVWSRTISDPLFAPMGSLAALAAFHFSSGMNVNLALTWPASGALTSIGVYGNPGMRGSWVIGDGTLVGGSANDVVIGALFDTGTPAALPSADYWLTLEQYWPYSPYLFTSDGDPTQTHCLTDTAYCYEWVGSYYGQTLGLPVRGFWYSGQSGLTSGFGHLLVIDGGGGTTLMVACSISSQSADWSCTLSGTGQLDSVTGTAAYQPGAPTGHYLQLFPLILQ